MGWFHHTGLFKSVGVNNSSVQQSDCATSADSKVSLKTQSKYTAFALDHVMCSFVLHCSGGKQTGSTAELGD